MPVSIHDVGIAPNPKSTLWRYLELDKFESLLKNKALFFCRADKFSDPFEGSIPKKEYDFRPDMHRRAAQFYNQEPDEEKIKKNISDMAYQHMELRRSHVVSCWHENSNESDAMWQLYLKTNEGVAVQTTTEHLVNSLNNSDKEIEISKVRYLDYDKEGFYGEDYRHRSYNLYMPFIHKRKEFSHEREVRLIYEIREAERDADYWDKQKNNKGVLIDVNVNTLIDKIILPPTSDEKVRQQVALIIKRWGYDFELERSALSKEAYF